MHTKKWKNREISLLSWVSINLCFLFSFSISCFINIQIDIRHVKEASGRSINLALSVRGISALEGAGVGSGILETLIPMKGRMIHMGKSGLSAQPYGVYGEVSLTCFLPPTFLIPEQLFSASIQLTANSWTSTYWPQQRNIQRSRLFLNTSW